METYRLQSKLIENDSEYVIQTSCDADHTSVSSTIYVNGETAESFCSPHPEQSGSEEILSLVKLKHGEVKKEIETLLEVFAEVMANGEASKMHNLGLAFYYKRLYIEARKLFQSAVRMDPQYHQAFNYLGITELAIGDVESAVEAALSAVEKRPGYADYRNNLGDAYLEGGLYQKALIEFEEAIRINLYYAEAYYNLGLTLLKNAITGENQELLANTLTRSVDCFNKASVIGSDYGTETFIAGLEAIKNNDFKTAYDLLYSERERRKDSQRREFAVFYMKFVMYPEWSNERTTNERIEYLRSEIQKNPSYVDLYSMLAHCYFEAAKASWNHGIQQYQRALEMNPSLSKTGGHLFEVESEYENICTVLNRIDEKE